MYMTNTPATLSNFKGYRFHKAKRWFLWRVCLAAPPHSCPAGRASRLKQRYCWQNVLSQETLSLQRTQACFEAIEQDPMLTYDLPPKPCLLAGQILKHCYEAVDKVLAAQTPCIFKVGYTHCAHFRFYNPKFGYRHASDKWEKLIVLYAANETISPAFVEGALIQRHKGFLNACVDAKTNEDMFVLIYFFWISIVNIDIP